MLARQPNCASGRLPSKGPIIGAIAMAELTMPRRLAASSRG